MPRPSLRVRAVVLALGATAATLGCTAPGPPDTDAAAAEATMQPADKVNVTVYYRHGRGPDAYLTPVVREVPVAADLPRLALQLLLDGPRSEDPSDLAPALPPQTRILGLTVDDGTATVDLSRHVVEQAGTVGGGAEHEALALAAVANTLTEFPAITRVRLTVEGKKAQRFWGTWGLPPVLVRDESVIDPQPSRDVMPALEHFSASAQRIGVDRTRPPVVSSVAVKPRTTYLRVTVEVTEPDGSALQGPVPAATARHAGGEVVLTVHAPAGRPVAGDLSGSYHDPSFPAARAEVRGDPQSVVVTVTPQQLSDFWLHTLAEPARVVLDIRR